MSKINRSGEPNSAGNRDITQGAFRTQLDGITDAIRQLGGNPELGPTSTEERDPLNSPFVLYVNPITGSDKYVAGDYASYDDNDYETKMKRISLQRLECGYTAARPFQSISRACVEAAIISSYDYLDLSPAPCGDLISIVLAPGVYEVDNGDGSATSDAWADGSTPNAAALEKFNAPTGGIILPRGASLVSLDLRKTIIRPKSVPAFANEQADLSNRKPIFRVTGGSYVYGLTFMDQTGSSDSHHLLDCFQFCSEAQLDSFYTKVRQAVGTTAGIDSSYAVSRKTEYEIVGPQPDSGQTKTTDTVQSSSPYIYNCSVRSTLGLCGITADGSAVPDSFKSVVIAQYTGVSLQKDMRCWQHYSGGDPGTWSNYAQSEYSDFIDEDPNNVRMDPRRLSHHVRAVNDAVIQEVSVFAIGQGVHHLAQSGGSLTVTNSNSNFGGVAALAKGFTSTVSPGDTPWDFIKVRRAVDPLSKQNITSKINIAVLESFSGTTITTADPIEDSPTEPGQPQVLAKDNYTLKGGDLIWIDDPDVQDGNPYAELAANPWDPANPTKINISGGWKIQSTNVDINGDSYTPDSKRILYVRRVKDVRTVDERRYSIILDGDTQSRLPNRDYVIQSITTSNDTDTTVSVSRAANTKEGGVGNNGVSVELRPTMRPKVDGAHSASVYYRKGDIVRKSNKHFSSGANQIGAFADGIWNEIYVHMDGDYVADSTIKNAQPILVFDLDTDSTDEKCGATITTSSVEAQLKSGSDYMGLKYFLDANTNVTNKTVCLALAPANQRLVNPNPKNNEVQFRKPSSIRLFSHAFEWSGYGPYTKGIPKYQGTLSPTNQFSYLFTNEGGGKVYASGFDQEGRVVTPQGLEDITTGELIAAEDIGEGVLDSTTYYQNLTVDSLTVNNDLILGDTAAQGFVATTEKLGIVSLLKYNELGKERYDEVITKFYLENWLNEQGYARSPVGIANVVLHVAKDCNDSGLTAAESIPEGYPTGSETSGYGSAAYLQFQPNGLFATVGEACAAAQKIFVPAGAEIVISVHNDLDETEYLPIIMGNSNQKFVVAGARGATVTPKIYIKSGFGEQAIDRIPEYRGLNISTVGAIYQDISIEWDTDKTNKPTLVIDGGLGLGSARDTIIEVNNIANDAQTTLVTGSPGGQVDLRIPARIAKVTDTYGDSERKLDVQCIYNNPGHTPSGAKDEIGLQVFGNGAGLGLTGHNLYVAMDFRELPWGDTSQPDLVFKFGHNLTTTGLPVILMGFGDRGGCKMGTRVEPKVTFDFCDNDWDYSEWICNKWYTNQNNMGLCFKTKEVINYKTANATAVLPSQLGANKIVFSAGNTVHGRTDLEDNDTGSGYMGGFTGVWKYFEIELGVTNPSSPNYKEYIMLFNEDMFAKMFTQGTGNADRSLSSYST